MTNTNNTQIAILKEFISAGYVRKASDWTSGTGRYVTKRTLPVYVVEIAVCNINQLNGIALKQAKKLLKANPKIQKILAVDNVRAVNKIIK